MKWKNENEIWTTNQLRLLLLVGVFLGGALGCLVGHYAVSPDCLEPVGWTTVDQAEALRLVSKIRGDVSELIDSIAVLSESFLVCTVWTVGTPSDTMPDPVEHLKNPWFPVFEIMVGEKFPDTVRVCYSDEYYSSLHDLTDVHVQYLADHL